MHVVFRCSLRAIAAVCGCRLLLGVYRNAVLLSVVVVVLLLFGVRPSFAHVCCLLLAVVA